MVWSLSFSIDNNVISDFKELMKADALMVSSFLKKDNSRKKLWDIEIFFDHKPDEREVGLQLSVLSALNNVKVPDYKIIYIQQKDWLRENQLSFSNLSISRFNVVHDEKKCMNLFCKIPVYVKAGHAFGTGYHSSTKGCIYALELLSKDRNLRKKLLTNKKYLEIGTGTGILTFVFCKLWNKNAIATDIDPESLIVSKSLAKKNNLGNRILFIKSDGMNSNIIRKNKKYALIIANILARPLKGFALQIKNNIIKGGKVVLSGLLEENLNYILNTYRSHGFFLEKKWVFEGWLTLVLRKA